MFKGSLFLLILLNIQSGSTATSYSIANGANQDITEFAVTKNVSNVSCGANIFVPTNTSAEWSAFYNNPPACVTVTNPSAACPIQVKSWNPGPCSATWPAKAHGVSWGPLNGNTGDGTGSATHTCNNGNWVFSSGSCTPTLN